MVHVFYLSILVKGPLDIYPKADKNLTITALVTIIPFLRVPITKQSACWPPFFFNEIYLNKNWSFLWLWKQESLIFQNITCTSI